MSRKEFLDELAFLLQDIPLVEQLEALQYYNDYFDDAGPEAEQDIIKELESPAKVAAMVKGGVSEEDGEFTERGYSNPHYRGPSYEMVEKEKQRRDKEDQSHPYSERQLWPRHGRTAGGALHNRFSGDYRDAKCRIRSDGRRGLRDVCGWGRAGSPSDRVPLHRLFLYSGRAGETVYAASDRSAVLRDRQRADWIRFAVIGALHIILREGAAGMYARAGQHV